MQAYKMVFSQNCWFGTQVSLHISVLGLRLSQDGHENTKTNLMLLHQLLNDNIKT